MLTDGDDEKPEMTCGGIDGSQRPPRAVLAQQHWVDVLVNKRRLGSSTSAACPEPEQSRLPLRPTHSANTLNSASCTAVRGAPPLRKKVVSSQRTTKAKARRSHSLLLLTYSAPGGLRQDTGRAAESAAGPRTDEDMGPRRACVVVDGRGRGDEPVVGLAVRLRALGAEVRVCAPPDWSGEGSKR